MSRLGTKFAALQIKKALLAYLVAGDPDKEITVDLMHAMVASGADAIELGVPFSDPEAEGPVIQLAHERALANQVSLADCFNMLAKFRERDQQTPVILMGYLNPIESMGYDVFAERSAAAGADGMIIVNLPPEEASELSGSLQRHDLDLVFLLAPTTTDTRAEMICDKSSGFVYYVSLKGTTGAATIDVDDVASKMSRFRLMSSLPVMVGFGIRDGETAAGAGQHADGVVVGSAIVDLVAKNATDPARIIEAVSSLISEIRLALDDLSG
ncbi:MAG: tryptophan synthase subunit alpha [Pseudomonadales bacterium]|nr:tryptophan synthase subunit alpha [Pseudomonadales bacterium]